MNGLKREMELRIGNLFGVDIVINPFFILVLFAVTALGLWGKLYLIYCIILVHELAHCVTARMLHVRIRQLEFLPFGVAAKIEEALELKPYSEAAIAVSGPLSNILMALVAVFLKYSFLPALEMVYFVQINLMLGGFNLLPALPMDGGRCLRALLSQKIGVKRSMGVVLMITKIIGIGALGTGVYFLTRKIISPNLFMIAGLLLFYAIRGSREKAYLQIRSVTFNNDRFKHSGSMGVRQLAVRDDTTLGRLVDMMVPGRYHIITVVNRNFSQSGQLDEGDIMNAYIKYGSNVPLRRIVGQK